MVRTKAAVRRLPVKTRRLTGWLIKGEYCKKKTIYSSKIKEILPEQKAANITKDGQVIKTVNVRRKSWYVNCKNKLIF